jgi:hypothetical protein
LFPNLPTASQDGAIVARGVEGFSSQCLAERRIAGIFLAEPEDGAVEVEWTNGGGGDAGVLSLPDVGGASEEADVESARMPPKWKADNEGFQNPTARKSKQAVSSSEELFPPDGRTSDGSIR